MKANAKPAFQELVFSPVRSFSMEHFSAPSPHPQQFAALVSVAAEEGERRS